MNDESRFWAKVDRSGDCWIWLRAQQGKGYGVAWFGGRVRLAHRLAYELLIGPIHEELQLDHLCRNRACVNPAHLEQVTNRENAIRGMVARNNWNRGEKNGNAKLTNRKVLDIRRLSAEGWRSDQLAKEFNVNRSVISRIVRRKMWENI